MFCTSCGKKNADTSNFCTGCGKRLVKPAAVAPVPVEEPVVPEVPVAIPEVPVTQETLIVPEIPEPAETPVVPEPPVAIPEVPVTQETLVVPEIPEEPAENQATIVVPQAPEIPEQDPVEELYPAPAKKKSNKAGLLIGLIVGLAAAAVLLISIIVLVIFGIASNWWRAPKQDASTIGSSTVTPTSPVDTPDEENLSADELRQKLTKFYAGGLDLYLSSDFEQEDGDNGSTFSTEDLEVQVFWGPMEKGVDSSREFSKSYEEDMASEFDDIQRLKANGIYYTVATDGDEVTVAGFYVQDGYGWMVQIVTDDFQAREKELINYVTLGQVSEGFVPPASDAVTGDPKEFVFAGLSLTLDSSFETSTYDQYCVYQNDGMMFLVQYCPLSSLTVQNSKEYAELYLDSSMEEGWSQLYMDTKDEQFYYVAMANDEDWVNLIGLYTYEDMAWIVMAETVDGKTYALTMANYITSGQIIPEQIPEIKPEVTVEFEGLELTLPGDYQVKDRNENAYITNGTLDIFIYADSVSSWPGNPESVEDLAKSDYQTYREIWDHVEMDSWGSVHYLIAYDNKADALSMACGYYMKGDTCWTVRVEGVGTESMGDMLQIAVSGVIVAESFEPDDLASRNRINLTGQAAAEFQGLRFSCNPGWKAETTWDDSTDYSSDNFAMSVSKFTLKDREVETALDLAWLEAEQNYMMWESYEVGLADGVPYVILCDESTELYTVIGTYADGTYCWEINVSFTGAEYLDQGIWYATAGVVL